MTSHRQWTIGDENNVVKGLKLGYDKQRIIKEFRLDSNDMIKKLELLTNFEEIMNKLRVFDKWATKIKKMYENDLPVNDKTSYPFCKNHIHFSIHSNGHLWATCETKDCINVAE